ncbi:MAG: SGNH/GDSL hydrolase family protein [Dysgonamonadaceae bacterium]|nr:SGNH/GDSL hydrolase family protein [Dysgonamonadaceae bacterium]
MLLTFLPAAARQSVFEIDSAVKGVMYDKVLNSNVSISELTLNGCGQYNAEGLNITQAGQMAKLEKFYALAERMVRYKVRFSADTKAEFLSDLGDFSACIDVPNKKISIRTTPISEVSVDFLRGGHDYRIEIYHIYQQAKVRIIDEQSGESAEVSAINDGTGGCGKGALQTGFSVGMQWDNYCFKLTEGASLLVKQITVFALKNKIKVLIYGDSITQPEGYFPSKDFPKSWTQQIIAKLNGNAMSSGRGGGTINTLLGYIKNELPFIEAEYVMVTIGTNGGNTEANLNELIDYIRSQGAIPILNNIPSNESSTQIEVNEVIEKVRRKHGINGCKFDVATSLNRDGQEVDKDMMWFEDYSTTTGWHDFFHHPNVKGSQKMFERTLIDVSEIYN